MKRKHLFFIVSLVLAPTSLFNMKEPGTAAGEEAATTETDNSVSLEQLPHNTSIRIVREHLTKLSRPYYDSYSCCIDHTKTFALIGVSDTSLKDPSTRIFSKCVQYSTNPTNLITAAAIGAYNENMLLVALGHADGVVVVIIFDTETHEARVLGKINPGKYNNVPLKNVTHVMFQDNGAVFITCRNQPHWSAICSIHNLKTPEFERQMQLFEEQMSRSKKQCRKK